jgi:hypothetical protein
MNTQLSRMPCWSARLPLASRIAQDKTSPEAYSRVAIGTGGGKTISFNFLSCST